MSNDQNPNLYPVRVVDETTPQTTEPSELAAPGYYRQGPAETAEPASHFGMREVMYIIFSHKIKVVAVFIVGLLFTISFVKNYPEYYESETNIKIKSILGQIYLSADDKQVVSSSNTRGNERYEIAVLSSYGLAESVVDRLGVEYVLYGPNWEEKLKARSEAKAAEKLEEPTIVQRLVGSLKSIPDSAKESLNLVRPTLTTRERAISKVQGGIYVKPTMSQSGILRVTYSASSPVVAKSILEEIVAVYTVMKENMRTRNLDKDKLAEEAEGYKKALRKKQNLLAKKRKDLGITDADHEIANRFSLLSSLENKVSEASVEARAIDERIKWLNTMLVNRKDQRIPMESMQAMENPYRDFLQKKIWELQLQEKELLATFKPTTAEVKSLRKRIQVLRTEMSQTMNLNLNSSNTSDTLAVDPVRQRIEQQLQQAQVSLAEIAARKKASKDEIVGVKAQIEKLRLHKQDVEMLVADIASDQSRYTSFQESLKLKGIDEKLAMMLDPNAKVLFPPTTPVGTTKNTRKLMALLGFGIFMSLIAGLALAFAIEFLNHTLKTTEEVERWLDLPVLMTIPYGKGHKPERDVA